MNSMPDTVGDVLYKMAYLIPPQSCEVVTDFITMLKWGNQNQDIEELLELLKCGKARLTSEPIILTKAQYLLSWSPLLVPCISNTFHSLWGYTPDWVPALPPCSSQSLVLNLSCISQISHFCLSPLLLLQYRPPSSPNMVSRLWSCLSQSHGPQNTIPGPALSAFPESLLAMQIHRLFPTLA